MFILRTGKEAAVTVETRDSWKMVGQSVSRADAVEKAVGGTLFADDFDIPGCLHGRVVRSGVASVVLDAMDVESARNLPGVRAVLTAEDAAVWLWTDPDGWFDTMHVAPDRRYRIEVRRPGADCPVHVVGHRVFRLLDFFSRRLAIQVPPCPLG